MVPAPSCPFVFLQAFRVQGGPSHSTWVLTQLPFCSLIFATFIPAYVLTEKPFLCAEIHADQPQYKDSGNSSSNYFYWCIHRENVQENISILFDLLQLLAFAFCILAFDGLLIYLYSSQCDLSQISALYFKKKKLWFSGNSNTPFEPVRWPVNTWTACDRYCILACQPPRGVIHSHSCSVVEVLLLAMESTPSPRLRQWSSSVTVSREAWWFVTSRQLLRLILTPKYGAESWPKCSRPVLFTYLPVTMIVTTESSSIK